MDGEVIAELAAFIEEERGNYRFELKKSTRIERDLKITGDDAVEFIMAFNERFDVDISEFMMDEYFEAEGMSHMLPIIDFLLRRKKKRTRKSLTIGDLEKAIELGYLI